MSPDILSRPVKKSHWTRNRMERRAYRRGMRIAAALREERRKKVDLVLRDMQRSIMTPNKIRELFGD